MTANGQYFNELCIRDVSVISGVRTLGRCVDHSSYGRKSCGFLYVWSGEATFYRPDGETTVVSGGELLFLPKRQCYRMEYTAPSTTFVVVDFALYGRAGEETALFEGITVAARENASYRIARIMADFELCGASVTACATLRKKELMYRLLGVVYSSDAPLLEKQRADHRIEEGVRLLEQTYLESLPISRYAEATHVSVSTFRSLFQKQFGISPIKYRNSLRIERAKELLREGGFTVSEAAYASGFESVGYFCRYYRQATGESPSETKRKYRILKVED